MAARRVIAGVLAMGAMLVPAFAGPKEAALADAVRAGDPARLRQLIAQHANVNLPLPDQSTVLAWAVDRHDEDMVRLLLAAGATPNHADQDGATPLLLACESAAQPQIIDQLLDAHADVHAARWDGVTVLGLCAGRSTPGVLERLIAAGAAPDGADRKGQTPLMWAAANGRLDNFAVLLKHDAKVNAASAKGFTPLFFAIKSGEPAMPRAVIAAGGDPTHVAPDGTTTLQLAIYQRDFGLAATLAGRGADLKAWDENGNTPLQAAAIAGDESLVKALLADGADPNALTIHSKVNWQKEPNSNTPVPPFVAMPALLLAAQEGKTGAMRLLVAGGAKKDFVAADGTNVLLAAATGGKLDALDYAFQLAPDPTVRTIAAKQDFNTLAQATGNDVMHSILFNKRMLVTGKVTPDTPAMMKLAAAKGAPLDGKDSRGHDLAYLVFRSNDDVKAAYAEILKSKGLTPPDAAAELAAK